MATAKRAIHEIEKQLGRIGRYMIDQERGSCSSKHGISDLRHRVRQRSGNRTISGGCLKDQKISMLWELARHPEHRPEVWKAIRCSARRPCSSKWCPICSDPKLRGSKARYIGGGVLVPDVCNVSGTRNGKKSSNYAVAAGQRMAAVFEGLPLENLWFITINLGLVPVNGDLKVEKDHVNRRLRRALKKLHAEALARGKFDIALKWADALNFGIPQTELPSELLGQPLPHQRVAMLHIHFILFDPDGTKETIREALEHEFPGSRRIRVQPATAEIEHATGVVTHGVQGALEYASLEKVELDFGDETTDAVVEFKTIDDTWSRRNKNLSHGQRTVRTQDAVINAKLTTLERFSRNNERLTRTIFGLAALYDSASLVDGIERMVTGITEGFHRRVFRSQPLSLEGCLRRLRIDQYCNSPRSKTPQGTQKYTVHPWIGRIPSGSWAFGVPP